MNGHPQFEEDFDLYALGVLDSEEKRAIESHVESCAACRNKLAAAQGRIALLALAAPPSAPPPRVKQQLMKRVQHDVKSLAAKAVSRPQGFWRYSAAAWAFAGAAAVVALALASWNFRLKKEMRTLQAESQVQQMTISRARVVLELLTAPDTQGITLTATPAKPQPEGRVYYHPNRGLLFYAANLPAAPAGRTYQLWLVPAEGSPISAGVFEPDRKGNASIVLPLLPSGVPAKAFAVTVEPSGGAPQPTGPKVLVGS